MKKRDLPEADPAVLQAKRAEAFERLRVIKERQAQEQERIKVRLALYQQAVAQLEDDPAADEVIAHGLTSDAAITYLHALIRHVKKLIIN